MSSRHGLPSSLDRPCLSQTSIGRTSQQDLQSSTLNTLICSHNYNATELNLCSRMPSYSLFCFINGIISYTLHCSLIISKDTAISKSFLEFIHKGELSSRFGKQVRERMALNFKRVLVVHIPVSHN